MGAPHETAAAAPRFFTVQCGHASWQACERAIAEGDDVDPWMPSGPPIAVPLPFAERRDTQIRPYVAAATGEIGLVPGG